MKSLIALPALVLALAGCQPKAVSSDVASTPVETAAANCSVHITKPWIDEETPLRRYTVDAYTSGDVCQVAVATLVIRAREGSPIYVWSSPAEYIFGLKDATDATTMKTALEAWVDQGSDARLNTTLALPAWEETDGQPKRLEFPFMPDSSLDKAAWDKLIADKLNMFCFPQGSESTRCAVLRDGQMEEIGVQLFPG